MPPTETNAPNTTPAPRHGLLLVNTGTPSAPERAAVRRYLSEFLADPEIISLPPAMRWFTPILARIIATVRSSASASKYAEIWTPEGSPLLVNTKAQAEALDAELGSEWKVSIGMRYGDPSIRSGLLELTASAVTDLTVLPMFPHYAGATIGSALREVYRVLGEDKFPVAVRVFSAWYDQPDYIQAQAEVINSYLAVQSFEPADTALVLSAHSLPVAYVQAGDPYQKHLLATVELLKQHLKWPSDRLEVAYQSRLGPVEWLTPSTEDVLRTTVARGTGKVVVCPISFTADCLESIHEIGVEYRQIFLSSGGEELALIPALNAHPVFIAALANLVRRDTTGGSNLD